MLLVVHNANATFPVPPRSLQELSMLKRVVDAEQNGTMENDAAVKNTFI
jgi:hypothetical protein